MNLRWRESVKYVVLDNLERDRNKQYEPRMLMLFGINLIITETYGIIFDPERKSIGRLNVKILYAVHV